MTVYTKRLICFVRADIAVQCNNRAKQYVDFAGGERVWDVPLERTVAPGIVAAYVCAWSMTLGQFTEMRNRLKEVEFNLDDKIRVFDVSGMTPEEEQAEMQLRLSNLGLKFMP